jgi:hypothetical protein
VSVRDNSVNPTNAEHCGVLLTLQHACGQIPDEVWCFMSHGSVDSSSKDDVLCSIKAARDGASRMVRFYVVLRYSVRLLKVFAALLTSGAAVGAITVKSGGQDQLLLLWLAAVSGILTALIETISREFEADTLRAHFQVYYVELKHLHEGLKLEHEPNQDLIKRYEERFYKLEIKEAHERPWSSTKPVDGEVNVLDEKTGHKNVDS